MSNFVANGGLSPPLSWEELLSQACLSDAEARREILRRKRSFIKYDLSAARFGSTLTSEERETWVAPVLKAALDRIALARKRREYPYTKEELEAQIAQAIAEVTLVRAAQEGNQDALAILVGLWEELLGGFFNPRVAPDQDADELVQETQVILVVSLKTLENPLAMTDWVLTIARRILAADTRRLEKLRSREVVWDEMREAQAPAKPSVFLGENLHRLRPLLMQKAREDTRPGQIAALLLEVWDQATEISAGPEEVALTLLNAWENLKARLQERYGWEDEKVYQAVYYFMRWLLPAWEQLE